MGTALGFEKPPVPEQHGSLYKRLSAMAALHVDAFAAFEFFLGTSDFELLQP